MHESVVTALQTHRPALRHRWEKRLRALPPSSALATPDALVHLMDWTLDRFFKELSAGKARSARASREDPCPCGLNPLLAYFVAAEDALIETLFMDEALWPALPGSAREEAIAAVRHAIQKVGHSEISSFCALCRHKEAGRRHQDHRTFAAGGA
jgi:hypothetical protein